MSRTSLLSFVLPFVCLALVTACSSSSRAPAVVMTVTAAPSEHSCKPEAPVTVTLVARGGELELVATPTADVPSVTLELILPDGVVLVDGASRATFGPTTAGQARTLAAHVRLGRQFAEIAGVARVDVAGIDMSRDATLVLGTPPPPAPVHRYALPDGELVEEAMAPPAVGVRP